MSLLDKARAVASQAAVKAKETAEDVQQKVELDRAYNALGKAAFEAMEAGELTSEKLAPLAAKIKKLQSAQQTEDEGTTTRPPAAAASATEPAGE